MKEAVDIPILRETIKQYILLIKKLTLTMNTAEEKELFDVILRHHEESSIIAANYYQAMSSLLENFRQNLFEQLNRKLDDRFIVFLGEGVEKTYSHIWRKRPRR